MLTGPLQPCAGAATISHCVGGRHIFTLHRLCAVGFNGVNGIVGIRSAAGRRNPGFKLGPDVIPVANVPPGHSCDEGRVYLREHSQPGGQPQAGGRAASCLTQLPAK
jgi:hypothetical protein